MVKEPFFYFKQLTPFPGVVLNKKFALEIGGFHAELHPIADVDFWYRYSKSYRMLLINQVMAFYRISPNQSTNHLIDRMINNVYKYRLNLIKAGPHNNIISKLALEEARINNIDFFRRMYPNISINSEEIYQLNKLKQAKLLLRFKLIHKIVHWYSKKISFAAPD